MPGDPHDRLAQLSPERKPKWIRFVEQPVPRGAKTRRWTVETLKGVEIARIQWYPGWRKYVFVPGYPTDWEEDCLRDVAAFIEQRTAEHKAQQKHRPTTQEQNDGQS